MVWEELYSWNWNENASWWITLSLWVLEDCWEDLALNNIDDAWVMTRIEVFVKSKFRTSLTEKTKASIWKKITWLYNNQISNEEAKKRWAHEMKWTEFESDEPTWSDMITMGDKPEYMEQVLREILSDSNVLWVIRESQNQQLKSNFWTDLNNLLN